MSTNGNENGNGERRQADRDQGRRRRRRLPGQLPAIYSALRIPRPDGGDLIAEVQQHLGDDRVRAVAMDCDRRHRPRHRRRRHRRRRSRCRSATSRSGASGTCSASRSTSKEAPPAGTERWSIHRDPPAFEELTPKIEIFETGHQGHRPDRPVRARRQDRPLRRRRRRQDGADPGADPQHRARARRRLGVLRRRRAHARGQRPAARDGAESGRDRQGRALLRADERAAGRAPARRPVRPDDGGVLPRPGPGRAALHRQHLPLRPGGLRGLRAARPHAERRRLPADARHRDGAAPGADHLDEQGLGHLGAGDLRPRRRPHRPGAGEHLRAPRLDDGALARARRAGHLPGGRPARLDLARAPAAASSRTSTTTSRRACRRSCSATRTCRTSSRSSGSRSSRTRTG